MTEQQQTPTENIETQGVKTKEQNIIDAEVIETETKKDEQDELFTGITVNQLTQNKDLGNVLHKILTLCHLSKTVDTKIVAWVKFVEAITKEEFEALSKIQKNFDFQIANRDFRNDEKLKAAFAQQQSANMTSRLTSLVDVPMMDRTLMHSQINLTEAEFAQLTPFFFPVNDIDIIAVA